MKRVLLSQVNNIYGRSAFLPYSVGLLQAYAQKDPVVRAEYEFLQPLFKRDPIEEVVQRVGKVNVAGISCYIWNWTYSINLAKAIKEANPDCLVVLGGPHVPYESQGFFHQHPYVDLLVHNEGELTFHEILTNSNYKDIKGISYPSEDGSTRKNFDRARIDDLDTIPSPYVTGTFDSLMKLDYDWHSIFEGTRGCPFLCAFCIAEDTFISTTSGMVKIQNLKDHKLITYSTSAGCEIESSFGKLICNGDHPVLKIVTESNYVETTSEHLIYTRDSKNRIGWKRASEIKIGDEVLSHLPQTIQTEEKESKLLREGLLGKIRCKEEDNICKPPARQVQGCCRICSKENVRRWQSYEKQGDCFKSKGQGQRENKEQGICSLDVYKGGEESYRRYCTQENEQREQPYEKQIYCCQSRSYQSKKKLIKDINQDEGAKSYEKQTFKGQGSKCAFGSRCTSKVAEKLVYSINSASKPFRGQVNIIFRGTQSSVLLYGGSELLGEGGEIKQKSRFCTCKQRSKKSYIGTWTLLAQGFRRCKKREKPLFESRMADFSDLGRRSIRRSNSTQNSQVFWDKVISVEVIGVKKVYDILNVEFTNNFFANSILVHNCDWGSATFSKVKKHSDAYLQEEIDWCAKHKIDLLYGADANTGILERDVALAEYMVKTKQQYGYPNKFRAAYAKNSVDRVFEINRILNKAGMSKGATLSFQSMDEHTLDVIKRKNIGTEKYKQLMSKYAKENIPTYSEIIIGLAGETYESFANGLDSLLRSGCHRGLSIYTCELLPNSEMSKPEYREKYGIQSVMSRVPFYHAVPSKDPYQEFYEIVTATKDLSKEDWVECQMLSWIIQGLHSLGLTHFLAATAYYRDGISYRQFYESLLKHARNNPDTVLGKLHHQIESYFIHINSGQEFPDLIDEFWGNICWPPEEWLYLNCISVIDDFFQQLPGWLPRDDAFFFQLDYCSSLYEGTTIPRTCNTNVVNFVNKVMVGDLIEWEDTTSTQYTVRCNKKWEGAQQFAKEVVWYGRKGNADFVEVLR